MKRIFRFFLVFLFSFFLVLWHPCSAARRGPIIVGVGAGYSFFLDSSLSSYEVYHPRLIYFSEQLNLKHNFHCHAQYFPWHGFGFQLEFDHQKASYHSDLKWYGSLTPDGKIIEIDHIEQPYKENWAITSITASILYVLNLRQDAKVRPYISAGFGYYFSSGDKDRFYDRTRLGPKTRGNQVKLGLGVKYRITPEIGINIRGVGGTIWRRERVSSPILYIGSDQFDINVYFKSGRIVRMEELLVNSFSFLGISASLEYTF